MDTSANNNTAAACSVPEMARKFGLSRARFYQLVKSGVLPPPVRCGTQRPSYPPDLQQQCLEIRRTRVGFNGLPVLFNKRRQGGRTRSVEGSKYDGLVVALKNMGLVVTASAVKRAVQALYPAGEEQNKDQSEVLLNLFKHFYPDCQKSV
jgi:predicted DNA-binding transcriptional regulator AlpA